LDVFRYTSAMPHLIVATKYNRSQTQFAARKRCTLAYVSHLQTHVDGQSA
jgi:hypothetical protein